MSEKTNAVEVSGLTKSYQGKTVLKDLELTVKRGTVFGLLGANGAGKSTSLECILGTKQADSGKALVLGMNARKNRKRLFQQVGVQFQECDYQPEIRVSELCEETACLYQNPADWRELCTRFGIGDKCEKSISHGKNLVKSLSGGERQRLFIVLALLGNPTLVFLDELTTGLDVKARRSVWSILETLKEQGLTIILTSHFMDEVEALCDEICILKKGETAFYGTVEQAKKQCGCEKFEDAYLMLAYEEAEEE